jgi:hypothetical protein
MSDPERIGSNEMQAEPSAAQSRAGLTVVCVLFNSADVI